jgi:FAD/FMN-containing dehydrogenase
MVVGGENHEADSVIYLPEIEHLILPRERLERVEAWGMSTASASYVYRPTNVEGIVEALGVARKLNLNVAIKGAGNSYGDAFQCSEGIVIDLTRMNRILEFDPVTGIIRCEAGVTIGDLWRYVIEDGWWPAVVSGTSKVTLGGALSANIHGKNNFKAGPLGEHVLSFDFLLPSGQLVHCTPNDDLFYAAIGGLGLLGAFTAIEIQLKKVHSGNLKVEAFACADWQNTFQVFRENESSDYLVAWIDGFAEKRESGRSLVHVADYLPEGADPHPEVTLNERAQALSDTVCGWIPKSKLHRLMSPFVTRLGMKMTNRMKVRAARREDGTKSLVRLAEFNFLLDSVPNWKLAYKPASLIQFQLFVPKEHAPAVFDDVTAYARDRGHPPYLSVMKRHRPDRFLLSHSVDGYSLALDFPVTRKNREDLWALTSELDQKVLAAGGRFYFVKDSTMSRSTAEAFLGLSLTRFLDIKAELDPEGLIQTSLSRRVFGES